MLLQSTLDLRKYFPSFGEDLMPGNGVEESEYLVKQHVCERICEEGKLPLHQ